MKVKLNPMFEQVSGQLGDLVFRELRGKTFASRKPTGSTAVPTVDQAAQRERFKQAAAYGKSALADPTIRTFYEEAAKSKNMPVFALTIADFFNAPTIETVDVSAYNGQVGSLIYMLTSDDLGVVSVRVSITNDQGAILENGAAIETAEGTGRWVYTATQAVAAGEDVVVNVIATDRPGGTAVRSNPKSL